MLRRCLLSLAIALAWAGCVFAEPPEPATPPPDATDAAAASPAEPSAPAPAVQPATDKNTTPDVPASQPSSSAAPPVEPPTAKPTRLTFNFRYQPWADVLDWFAEQAGYSLVLDNAPPGTFNYRDNRTYSPAEAIDLLNSVLLTKGYTLVLRDRMLLLVNLEDEIPPSLVTQVPADELDHRGQYELVSTRFALKNLSAEEAQKEIEELLGPEGRVVVLPKAQQIVVTETGGRLREIRDVLTRADGSRDPDQQEVRWFELRAIGPDEALAMLRQVFDIAEGSTSTADGSLHLAADPLGLRLLATGSPQRIRQVVKIMETLDKPFDGEPVDSGPQAAPQLEVYDVAPADPEAVLKVMQTLLADTPGTRLATDPKTGNLIALARPKDQATVRATIDQIRRDAQSVEVIQLRVIDPQLAVLAIEKLFGKEADKAPSIDADVANRQLLVRGSAGQIAQIKILLEKMGETFGAGPALAGGKLRKIPVAGGQAEELIERVRQFWPVMGSNELRVVPHHPAPDRGPIGRPAPPRGPIDQRTPVPGPAIPAEPDEPLMPLSTTWREPSAPTPASGRARVTFAATGEDRVVNSPEAPPQDSPNDSGKPPIIVLPAPDGLYLSSDDVEALDTLQRLIDTLQGGSTASEPKLTVFYLRNADAKTVAERLKEILATATPTTGTPPSGAARTSDSAGILGSFGAAGTFGRITPSGPISITPDPRLNALLVQAAPPDVDLIEEILKILDRRDSPEDVPAQPKPRLIPVFHTSASEIAQVIKDVYQDRMGSGENGNRPLSPPEMMMRMFRGQRGGGGASSGSTTSGKDAAAKMTLGVDERSNSLIVSAPQSLFVEVRDLVAALDRVASQDQETIEVVALPESNPEAVRAALASLLGDAVETSSTPSAAGASSRSRNQASGANQLPFFMRQSNRGSNWQGSSSGRRGSQGNQSRQFQPPRQFQSPQRGR